ncbi:hypothetical protein BH23THE1_BH23THE1_28400 [soil metagenome]
MNLVKITILSAFYITNKLKQLSSLINIEKYYPKNLVVNDVIPSYQGERVTAIDRLRKFGMDAHCYDMPAIYFDHKVAYETSTYSGIYSQGRISDDKAYGSLFKVDPSREKIEELEKLFKEYK